MCLMLLTPSVFFGERKAPGAGWKTDVGPRALLNKFTRKKKRSRAQVNTGKRKVGQNPSIEKDALNFLQSRQDRRPETSAVPSAVPICLMCMMSLFGFLYH